MDPCSAKRTLDLINGPWTLDMQNIDLQNALKIIEIAQRPYICKMNCKMDPGYISEWSKDPIYAKWALDEQSGLYFCKADKDCSWIYILLEIIKKYVQIPYFW